jgi:peptide/nickel transport system permease protein
MAIGFLGGYLGGVIDEVLSMVTNIVLVIPTLAVLIIVSAYLSVGSLWSEALLIGLTSWPWAARAIRAQTF